MKISEIETTYPVEKRLGVLRQALEIAEQQKYVQQVNVVMAGALGDEQQKAQASLGVVQAETSIQLLTQAISNLEHEVGSDAS